MTEQELIDKYAKQLARYTQIAIKHLANLDVTVGEETIRNHLILFTEDLKNLEPQDQK